MKNLKRVLSLALTGVMLVGMMAIGASAANKDFTDADEIQHTEAVSVMSTLGVLKGKDTGAFDPAATVTRAEMAKIICVMLNGGNDPTLGTSGANMFSDTANHWAKSYIEYCASMNIIAGQGDGTFAPDAPVTGAAAAKMLLVAMGYDSKIFEFTGPDWEINVNRRANEAKLYEEIKNIDTSAGLSRDNTAQMAYNALEAKIMKTSYDKVVSTGEVSWKYDLSDKTFLNEYFDAYTFIGTYKGNKDNGAATNEGEICVNGKLDTAEANAPKTDAKFPSDLDISNIGEEVKVIFKDAKGGVLNKPDKRDTIYGVFNTGATQVINATKNDIGNLKTSEFKIKIDGSEYETTNTVAVYKNYINTAANTAAGGTSSANSALTDLLKAQDVDTIKFVCNEDGRIFAAYVTEWKTGKVTAVTSSKLTISGVGAIEIADNDIYENPAKDDVVVYTRYYNDTEKDKAYFTVTKAETVEGKLTGYKLDKSVKNGTETNNTFVNVSVDDTVYKVNDPATTIDELTDDAVTAPGTTGGVIGDTVRLYLVKGMVAAIQSLESTGGNYAVITDKALAANNNWGSDLDPDRVAILTADGTKQTLVVHKDSMYDGTNKMNGATYNASSNAGGKDHWLVAGNVVEYSMSGDKLKIKKVVVPATIQDANASTPNKVWDADTMKFTYSTDGSSDTVATAAANATLFVKVGTDYYAYEMRGLRSITNTVSGTGTHLTSAMTNSDGLVKVGYAELTVKPNSGTSSTLYGIIASKEGAVQIDKEDYTRYTVAANNGETVEVNISGSTSKAVGDIVYFDEASDKCYSDTEIKVLSGAGTDGKVNGTAIAVKNYDPASRLLTYHLGTQFNGTSKVYEGFKEAACSNAGANSITVDKEAVFAYVNQDGDKAGDEIGVGGFDTSEGYANALMFDKDSDGLIDVIVVETSGKANVVNGTLSAFRKGAVVSHSIAQTATVTKTNDTGFEGEYSISVASTGAEGATITITVTCTQAPAHNTTSDKDTTDTLTITTTPSATVSPATLTVDGTTVSNDGKVTFTMPTADVTAINIAIANADKT